MVQAGSKQLLIPSSDERAAKQFRLLRNALFLNLRQSASHIVLVTSPEDHQGKSTIAANLAASYATQGTKTLLIDANFQHPQLANAFDITATSGLSALAGAAEAISDTTITNLSVLPAGEMMEDSSGLFLAPEFESLLKQLAAQYDAIFIDGGSILHRSDTQVLATLSDYTLLVVNHAQVKKADFMVLQDELKDSGITSYGVVYNELPSKRKKYDF